MNGLKFTEEAAGRLEKFYRTKDIAAQRVETVRHLNLTGGESVLDIGCGPGFLCESMSEIVGRNGAVVGIDIDADHGDRCVEFLRHGVLLVLSAPCQFLVLAGPEHGRTIPLADIRFFTCCAADSLALLFSPKM